MLRNRVLEMGGKPIEGVADGVADTDAVNKGQMDTAIADEIAAAAHDPVTLAGTPDYITLSGQVITRGQIDLTADVTGVLPIGNYATGTPDGTKFLRDDGSWQAVATDPWSDGITTADLSKSDTTKADVSADLSFAVEANTDYVAFFDLLYKSSGSFITIGLNGPSGATFSMANNGSTYAGTATYDTTAWGGTSSTSMFSVRLQLEFSNGANAGTVALRWWLNTGTTTVYILKGSTLRYRAV